MKKIKNLRSLLVTLGMITAGTSCKKEAFETMVPIQPEQSQIQTVQPESGNKLRESGCILLSSLEYSKLPKAPDLLNVCSTLSTVTLPCPPVKDQGSEGSCVAFGAVYAARSIKANPTGGSWSNSTNLFSPEYVYNLIKISADCSKGSYVVDALKLMSPTGVGGGGGVCRWSKMPYTDAGCSQIPSPTAFSDAANGIIPSWGTATISILSFKTLLSLNIPIIVCGPVDINFQNLGSGVYTSYNPLLKTGDHCYCIVGYDGNKNAFKVINSWGTGWGNNGFGWISYGLVNTMFKEAYVML